MKKGVYSLYDVKIERFNDPFLTFDDAMAVASVERGNLPPYLIQDGRLFKLGEYDDKTGAFNLLPEPLMLPIFVKKESDNNA